MASTYDIIIIGAGVAGLSAARDLTTSGYKVALLEARDRIGGRIYSYHDPAQGNTVELGAEFIHGRPPQTLSILREAGLEWHGMTGSSWYSRGGKLTQDSSEDERIERIYQKMAEVETDLSLTDFLEAYFPGGEWREAAASVKSYVEGYDAAHADRASIHWILKEIAASEQNQGDHNYRTAKPYDSVAHYLLSACNPSNTDLHLNTVVKSVRWERGKVEILTESGQSFGGRCALVTLPLGVLRASPDAPGAVRFEPALAEKAAALLRLDMGQIVKVILCFSDRFWEQDLPNADHNNLSNLSFLVSDDPQIRVWWTQDSSDSMTLTGWAGYSQAVRLIGRGEAFIVEQAVAALARILGVERGFIEAQLQSSYVHDWGDDPFARGAYSYVMVDGLDAVRQLAEPLADTLFFAGEATDTEWRTGTVHGAIATGGRAAREIAERVRLDEVQ
jgi:monoamine oxidase